MPETIGKILKSLRLCAGYNSLGQLNKVSGVTVATLSRIESGIQTPSPATLKRLAPCLGVTLEYLMGAAGHLSNIDIDKKNIDLLEILNNSNINLTFGNRVISRDERSMILGILNNALLSDTARKDSGTILHVLDDSSGNAAENKVNYCDIDSCLNNAAIAASHQGKQIMRSVPTGLREIIKQEIIEILKERESKR